MFHQSIVLICKTDCLSCNESRQQFEQQQLKKPTIYLITPTYDRFEQLAELTRLSQTLLLVNRLHWLLIEDSPFKTNKIKQFITSFILKKKPKFNSDIKIEHLNIETPIAFKISKNQPNWLKPKGI